MFHESLKSLDILDWIMAAGICGVTLVLFTLSVDLGQLAVDAWGWRGQLLRVGGSAALGLGGAAVTIGFVMRSRLVYVVLILASVVGVLSFLFLPPALFMLYGLLRKRGRQSFFFPEDLELAQPLLARALEPVPAPTLQAQPQDATQVFRRRSFEQEQTVLMHGAELAELQLAPEPEPEKVEQRECQEDQTVPDQLEIVTGWILAGYGLFTFLGALGFLCMSVFYLSREGALESQEILQVSALFASGSLPFFVTAAGCWSTWRGLYSRERWTWIVGIILGLSMLATGNLPIGALLLFCLLREKGRVSFGMVGLEHRLGLRAAA